MTDLSPALRRVALVALALFALALPSCITAEQDIWLYDDGGGRAVIKLGISKQMLAMASSFGGLEGGEESPAGGEAADPFEVDAMKKALAESDNVTSFEISESEDDKYKYVEVDIAVNDITKLKEIQKEVMADGPAADAGGGDDGEFEITRSSEGTFIIKSEFKAPAGEDLGMGGAMFMGMVGDAAIVTRVHAQPVSEDAHNGTVEEDAIVWRLPLSELLSGKSMSIEGEFLPTGSAGPSSTTFWIVLASVLAVAVLLFFIFRAQGPKLA